MMRNVIPGNTTSFKPFLRNVVSNLVAVRAVS